MRKFSTRDFQKVLKKNGYVLERTKGSHLIYKNEEGTHIAIYQCGRGIAPSVTHKLIRDHSLKVA